MNGSWNSFDNYVFALFLCVLACVTSFPRLGSALRYRSKQLGVAMVSKTELRPREYRNLKPLPCYGMWNPDKTLRQNAMFLAPEQMSVRQRVDGNMIAKGLMPIVIPTELEFGLGAAMKTASTDIVFNGWSGAVITDRSGGLYDNVDKVLANIGPMGAKREIYNSLKMRGSCPSPYHGIVAALDAHADVAVTGLLIEVADRPNKYSIALGAAVMLAKEEVRKNWRLTASRARLIGDQQKSEDAYLVKCHMDELLGIALATGLPIVIKSSLYEPLAVDGLLEKQNRKRIQVKAPFFGNDIDRSMWKRSQDEQKVAQKRQIQEKGTNIPKANEIPDATTFLTMTISAKRACLRASGVKSLPRPREGPRAVDALMIPLLDEEVAYEVLRRLAETRGDSELAAQMKDYESRKPTLARQIREARERGDHDLAEELCDELNGLSTLRFDPTDPENLRGVEWDVEEWYWEQRKRVYGIIAA